VPDTRRHRGPDPRDAQAFAPEAWPALRAAVADLSWLWERGYAPPSSLKLVGDRWSLTERQRAAVARCACSDSALQRRSQHRIEPSDARGKPLAIDGFNLLTTIEAALGGAVVLCGRDGCYRDLAGVHGTYRQVEETRPGVQLVGEVLASLGAGHCLWYLDRPVSNSGRLRNAILAMAEKEGWDWEVELAFSPDALLAASSAIVATADSAILDRCERWVNLARHVVETRVSEAFVVDRAVSLI
jgi:hypothetical protein